MLGIIWLIFLISPAHGLVILDTMIPTVAIIGFYAARLQPQWRKVHDLHGAMTTVIQAHTAGVRVVKAFEGLSTQKSLSKNDSLMKSSVPLTGSVNRCVRS